jgi:hypothetical protein
MSDFDEVLERLLGDPGFKSRLAADPASALAGYQLSPDELDILQSQMGDTGGQSRVEQRTSKASMFGVFSSIGSGLGDVLHGHGYAHPTGPGLGGHGGGADASQVGQRMHDLVDQEAGGRHAAVEPADAQGSGLGHHVADVQQGGGRHAAAGFEESHSETHSESHLETHVETSSSGGHLSQASSSSSGTVYQSSTYASGTGGTPTAPPVGPGGLGGGLGGLAQQAGHAQIPGAAPTDGYHTRVDWDGDGRWDQHTYVNRADGGVDIVVDTDGDGRAEFVGHDTDRDGLINSSEIDTNHDGVMDARYEDLNGDGWLDRRTK